MSHGHTHRFSGSTIAFHYISLQQIECEDASNGHDLVTSFFSPRSKCITYAYHKREHEQSEQANRKPITRIITMLTMSVQPTNWVKHYSFACWNIIPYRMAVSGRGKHKHYAIIAFDTSPRRQTHVLQ